MFSNQRYAELLNLPPDQVEGVDPPTYYADREFYADGLARLTRGEDVRDLLVELNIPGVGAKWTIASYFPIQYESETAVMGWFHDIADRKQIEHFASSTQESSSVARFPPVFPVRRIVPTTAAANC